MELGHVQAGGDGQLLFKAQLSPVIIGHADGHQISAALDDHADLAFFLLHASGGLHRIAQGVTEQGVDLRLREEFQATPVPQKAQLDMVPLAQQGPVGQQHVQGLAAGVVGLVVNIDQGLDLPLLVVGEGEVVILQLVADVVTLHVDELDGILALG